MTSAGNGQKGVLRKTGIHRLVKFERRYRGLLKIANFLFFHVEGFRKVINFNFLFFFKGYF